MREVLEMLIMINSLVVVVECYFCISFKFEYIFYFGMYNYRSVWKRKICLNKKFIVVESG